MTRTLFLLHTPASKLEWYRSSITYYSFSSFSFPILFPGEEEKVRGMKIPLLPAGKESIGGKG